MWIQREIPMHVTGGWPPLSLHPLVTAELTADWKVSAPPIEKMSPRNQITASTRVDARGDGSSCSRTVKREGTGRVEIVMAFVSQALSGIGARFRQEDQISSDSLEMRTASRLVHLALVISSALIRFRESIAIDFMESVNNWWISEMNETRNAFYEWL